MRHEYLQVLPFLQMELSTRGTILFSLQTDWANVERLYKVNLPSTVELKYLILRKAAITAGTWLSAERPYGLSIPLSEWADQTGLFQDIAHYLPHLADSLKI
jgi:hypothetical protein